MSKPERYFHIHLVSDSTGETLITASRAVSSQYRNTHPVEHIHRMIRSSAKLDEVISAIDDKPGIVLFTLADPQLVKQLKTHCRDMGVPCISLLEPVFNAFQSYLGEASSHKSGAQHELNSEYFARIDALNFALLHDDGNLPDDLSEADIVVIGISRTSKTPTAIYLANNGLRVANMPLVPGLAPPPQLAGNNKVFVVALIASTDRIYQVRQNRIAELGVDVNLELYTNRADIAEELAYTRKLCQRHNWPVIDVSRKSVEETAAAIIAAYEAHKLYQKEQKASAGISENQAPTGR